MQKRLTAVTAMLTVGLFFTFVSVAHASTIFNNLNSTTSGSDSVSSSGPLADSFSTGSSSFSLGQVTVKVQATTPGDGESVVVSLLSDNASSPGSTLDTIGTINDSSLSTSLSDFALTLSTPYTLAANTTYWIELSTSNGSSAYWAWSLDQTALGVSGEQYSDKDGIYPDSGGPYQMELLSAAVAAPETGTLLLLGIGLLALMGAAVVRRTRYAGVNG